MISRFPSNNMNAMTHTFKNLLATGALLALTGIPALALAEEPASVTGAATANVTSAPASVGVTGTANVTTATPPVKTAAMIKMEERANREIDRRTENLNGLLSKVGAIRNLSSADKTSIQTAVTNQVSALTQLRAKIAADADAATMKTDVQSITDSYRIYALVMPQIHIITAADRVVTVAGEMQLFAAKLEARIAAAQSSGADMTSAAAAYAEFNQKLSDAMSQSQAAVNAIAVLLPDQGDKTKMASNTATLKDARAKIVAAQKDLVAAKKDAVTISIAVKGKPVTAVAPAASTTPPAQTTGQ